jgi:hypothetical protein
MALKAIAKAVVCAAPVLQEEDRVTLVGNAVAEDDFVLYRLSARE